MKLLQIGQQQAAGYSVACPDDQLTHHQFARLLQLFLSRFDQADGAAHIVIQHPPLTGQGHAARLAGKQPHLQLLLQLVNGLADRRLRNEQRLGGGGDAFLLCHRAKNAVKLQFDCHSEEFLSHLFYLCFTLEIYTLLIRMLLLYWECCKKQVLIFDWNK